MELVGLYRLEWIRAWAPLGASKALHYLVNFMKSLTAINTFLLLVAMYFKCACTPLDVFAAVIYGPKFLIILSACHLLQYESYYCLEYFITWTTACHLALDLCDYT